MEKLISCVCGNEVLIFGGTQKLRHYVEASRGAALNVADSFDGMSPKAQRLSVGLPETWEHFKPLSKDDRLKAAASRRLAANAEMKRKRKLH